ncbi:GDSL esterase/lipase 1 isoform X1 [Ziziphus jujuba]|uniref:GDSL esterase/lipase 1 isoform X1 n=1 Tax=Ziziphus jujuba TaxID=326968 RepID=A0ABM3IJA7_ZIZJJ|nr:GDSL esterase/lipase 1-like isoform X1 [Ziziphus jujuba var. spinosa]XP_048329643.1 GDSL esterase/lipase 1 isoform X1 [Ziziphus jujuba]
MAKLNFCLSIFVFCISLFNIQTKCFDERPWLYKHHAALFIFGDSLFDAGNNNYINATIGKANFWPYGETFFHHPTGRFCDGRLVPDFIAEYAKLPFIPPYLQPGNKLFIYGVNFASGGAGALVETGKGSVIDLQTQLGYFKNVSRVLREELGDAKAEALLSRAVYLFSVGTNDYAFPFETNSSVLYTYSVEQYVGQVIGNITQVIKEIYEVGGRKFGFPNLGPIECAPFSRTMVPAGENKCFEPFTPYVELHNIEISKLFQELQSDLKGVKYSILDFRAVGQDLINYPSKYGFKEGKVACCGSGPYRGILSCGGRRGVREFYLCDNVSDYVFFDSGHPTERTNEILAHLAWSGGPNVTGPCNLAALFEF